MSKQESTFDKLNKLDVSDKVEIKDTGRVKLSYLSWAWAWAEAKKLYPDVQVSVAENEQGLPYFTSDEGIMVKVGVEIEGINHTVYLPVMDGANNAMKTVDYTFKTKYGEKEVKAATMMDINKTIQRAIVKGLGLHGLGLYIYAGEDLPEGQEKSDTKAKKEVKSPVKKKDEKKSGNSFRKSVKPEQEVTEDEEL